MRRMVQLIDGSFHSLLLFYVLLLYYSVDYYSVKFVTSLEYYHTKPAAKMLIGQARSGHDDKPKKDSSVPASTSSNIRINNNLDYHAFQSPN